MSTRALAERRTQLHVSHASRRPLSEDYDYVGLRGEQAFAQLTGLSLDAEDRPAGDRGRDFYVPANPNRRGFTIDVKTHRKPWNLIVEQGKVDADAYVLARYYDQGDEVELLGWEGAKAVRQLPVRDFGFGVLNHYKRAQDLRPLSSLLEHAAAQEDVTCRCGRRFYQARIDWHLCLRCELEDPCLKAGEQPADV